MQAVEIRPDIYWVGAVDWSLRNFHGYQTGRGATYNAYLIIDEHITLIDTVKAGFETELLARISSVIDPAKIDYIVSSHVEPDHSGGLPFMHQYAPNAKIITSLPNGLKGLTARYGELPYQGVKAGETLSLGKRTLNFVTTPMLHWPDSMVSYCPEEKILFSNDAFGQHFASSGRFDDENDLPTLMWEAQKYYANILFPYGKQAQTALQALGGLDISLLATGHGILWRSHIADIVAAYKKWSAGEVLPKAVVVFDSMWHSTEMMAKAVVEGFRARGTQVTYYDLKVNTLSDIVTEILTSKYIAVGSPTLNNQMMPTVAGFMNYLKGLQPRGRQGFAFGSYGWSGQSIGLVEDALKEAGVEIIADKIRQLNVPTAAQLTELTDKVKNLTL